MKLVDTSVVVDIDRGDVDRRVGKLDDEGRHAISVVTLTELRLGVNKLHDPGTDARETALTALDRLLARFEVLPLTRASAAAAGDIIDNLRREGLPLDDLHDVYIAATAQTKQLPVLTGNVAHFDRIDDVRVVDWAEY